MCSFFLHFWFCSYLLVFNRWSILRMKRRKRVTWLGCSPYIFPKWHLGVQHMSWAYGERLPTTIHMWKQQSMHTLELHSPVQLISQAGFFMTKFEIQGKLKSYTLASIVVRDEASTCICVHNENDDDEVDEDKRGCHALSITIIGRSWNC